jgi:DNA-binding NtrC family response regulator/tetratricopeptide (TPR) repeat protein
MPVQESAGDNRCVRFDGVSPGGSPLLESLDSDALAERVKSPPEPRSLLVLRKKYLDDLLSRLPEIRARLTVAEQHEAKGLKPYLLRKKKPVALLGKYKKAGRLKSAIHKFMAQARKAEDSNLYLIAVNDEVFTEISDLSSGRGGSDRRAPPVEIPAELREKFWGDSQEAETVREAIIKAARMEEFSGKPVLILGDPGCGKDIVAEEIHNYGRGRSGGEFRGLNCAAIPSDLLEAELFGIDDGVVPGVRGRPGLWEMASRSRGTLFLDEIGDLRIEHQAKVLRALEKNMIRHVGGLKEIKVQARILAATNRDLIKMVGEGSFRLDLYTRLARIVIRVPRLAGNSKDVRQSAQRIWQEVTGKKEAILSPDVIRLLSDYAWPGGIRELRNFLEGLYFQIYGNVNARLNEVKEYWRYRDPSMVWSPEEIGLDTLGRSARKGKRQAARVSGRVTRAWVERQANRYRAELPRYVELSQVLRQVLEAMASDLAPLAIVQIRTRSAASFAEKIQRLSHNGDYSRLNLPDCCGARVIVQTTEDVKRVASFIGMHFEIDPERSRRLDRLPVPGTHSYQPNFYFVRLNRARADKLAKVLGVQIGDEVLGLWAEIQIRTVLEQAWTNICRETMRGSSCPIAGKWANELTALGELLKAVDQSFSRIQRGLQTSNRCYSNYAARNDLLREIDILETVLACDSGNAHVAARIGRLALALGDWDLGIRFMEPHAGSGFQPLLRDLGIALCQKYVGETGAPMYARGQQLLEMACASPARDPDAFASLAGTWKRRGDLQKARDLYLSAHAIDPTDSYALGCYLELELKLEPQSDVITTLKPSIERAIERCLDLAAAGVNLPWACFDLGKFQLLLGKPVQSFSAYSRAVQLSTSAHMIRTSLDSLDLLGEARPAIENLDEVRQLLVLGLAARFPGGAAARDARSKGWPAREKLAAPVVILCGELEVASGEKGDASCRALLEAFKGFCGTLVTSTSNREIVDLSLDLGKRYSTALKTFTYRDRQDSRASQTSLAMALKVWTDVVGSGIDPAHVLTLGFGRGETWAAQCFNALALGGRIVAVRSLAAADVSVPSDENWEGADRIERVAAETHALRAVLADFRPASRK